MRLSTLHKVAAHDEGIWSAAWIPGTSQLLTGSVDEKVKVWEETQEGLRMVHTYEGHTLGVVSVVVDSTGASAASSSLDSMIRVWDLRDGSTKALIETAPTETWSIACGPQQDALYIATAAGTRNSVVIWRIGDQETSVSGELAMPTAGGEKSAKTSQFVLSVAYSPDGLRIAAGAMDGTVAVFDTTTSKLLYRLEGHHRPVRCVVFSPDSALLLTACDDMHINLYDVEGGALVDGFSGHESWVLSVAMNPQGTGFVSGGSDAKVKLWDIGSRSCVQTAVEHTDQVWAVAYNSDGTRLLTCGDDKQAIIYSVA
ncbi:MAG: hypothetical protein WDW38_003805 [Sanguina aurantia]